MVSAETGNDPHTYSTASLARIAHRPQGRRAQRDEVGYRPARNAGHETSQAATPWWAIPALRPESTSYFFHGM
jgi:hypothetical protein